MDLSRFSHLKRLRCVDSHSSSAVFSTFANIASVPFPLSLQIAERGQARDAGFFVFPDLSVRTEGTYRLKLTLFEVVGPTVQHCKSVFSAPFYVYTAKKFPGMEGECLKFRFLLFSALHVLAFALVGLTRVWCPFPG